MLKTNFNYLNKSLGGGFRTKCLYTLCGESGKGKTTLANQLISDFAKQGVKSVFISLEMDKAELICRIMANLTGITYLRLDKYQRNELRFSNDEITKINNVDEYIKNILVLENSEFAELTQLKNAIKYLATNGYKLFVIDELCDINIKHGHSRDDKIKDIMRDLRFLAQDQNISILIISKACTNICKVADTAHPSVWDTESDCICYYCNGLFFIYNTLTNKDLFLYTAKNHFAKIADEKQKIEIDNCLRVCEIN